MLKQWLDQTFSIFKKRSLVSYVCEEKSYKNVFAALLKGFVKTAHWTASYDFRSWNLFFEVRLWFGKPSDEKKGSTSLTIATVNIVIQ